MSIYKEFVKQVKKNPNKLAVIDSEHELTYLELEQLVNQISSNIKPKAKKVAVIMDHSVFQIASILAILKLGKAFVPVEPTFPKKRIEFILDNAEVDQILTNKKYQESLKNSVVVEELKNKKTIGKSQKEDDLAYILYTSGSTGKPKGVCITNKNVLNYIKAFNNEFNIRPDDRILQQSVCTFDIFIEEIFSSLLLGMTLVIPDKEALLETNKLNQFIKDKKITIVSGFPYLLYELNKQENIPNTLRLLISGGDVLRDDYITNLKDKVSIYNTYGPSETTVCATYYCCDNKKALEDGTYPIGKAVKGVSVNILDKNLKPVKIGEIGEIIISGNGVGNGYFKHSEENYITLNNKKAFRTGDLGYFLKDGNLVFTNRLDDQIMIKGKRVEPKEVENYLADFELVEKAAVTTKTSNHENSLVAYIVLKDKLNQIEEIKQYLSDFLPDYMIPSEFIIVPDIPLNLNGKIDFKKLSLIKNE